MSKIKLTVSPEVREKMQRKQQKLDGDMTQLALYVRSGFAAKLHQLAQSNKRSVSSVMAEMLEFAMSSLEEGDTELEHTPSTMHPLPSTSPLSYNDLAPGKQSKGKVTLRMTTGADQRPMTSAEIAEKTLNERMGNLPDYDGMSEASWQRESSAKNGYRWHELVDE